MPSCIVRTISLEFCCNVKFYGPMYITHHDFSPVFHLCNSCNVSIKMAADHEKHCCRASVVLSKMPGSPRLQNVNQSRICRDMLPGCRKLEDKTGQQQQQQCRWCGPASQTNDYQLPQQLPAQRIRNTLSSVLHLPTSIKFSHGWCVCVCDVRAYAQMGGWIRH